MRLWPIAIAWLCILIAVLAARPRATPGPYLRDFEAYWSAGAAWNAGADPYGRAIWNEERNVAGVDATRDEILPFVNPPYTLATWSLFARLSYAVAARIWTTILVASVGVLVVAILFATQTAFRFTVLLAALALAVAFGPITSDIALGQLALPAFTGAVLVAILGESSLGAATAAVCVAFAQPNVAIGLISRLGRRHVTLALLFATAIAYAVGAVYAGPAWPLWYSGRLIPAHGIAERYSVIQITVISVAHSLGASKTAAMLLAAAAFALTVFALVEVARRVDDPFGRFAGFCALGPFVAGFVHEHDLVVAYPAALWCALRTRGMARGIALAGTLLVSIDWLGLAQRPSGIVQSALLASAALAAFSAFGSQSVRCVALTAILPVAALFAGAAWLAAQHVAPVWPDSLGAFRALPGQEIAAVWAAEQRASGLLAMVPAWGALRALSLLGCALLAYAIYRHSSYCRTA
jgi:hypothetical protein